jgi:NDP-sugar pyrophosphorylase family protein
MGEPRLLQSGVVDVRFGERVKVVQPVNIYGCSIGDDCFVGPFVEIQRDVAVGARCKVQSHAFICELVTIGDDCFIGHGVMFINDVFATGGGSARRQVAVAIDQDWIASVAGIECDDPAREHLRRCGRGGGCRRHEGHQQAWHLCGQSSTPLESD